MAGYFQRSQEIRKQIEKSEDLIDGILGVWGLSEHSKDLIGDGENNQVHRIGKLESGLWVALRTPQEDRNSSIVLAQYEFYCQMAEEYHDANKLATSFCVGVYGPGQHYRGILIEDFTVGGKRQIDMIDGLSGRFRDDSRVVHLDLDNLYVGRDPKPKYFRLENAINLLTREK